LPLLGIAHDALVDQEGRQVLGGPVTDWSAYGLVFTTANGHPVEPRNLARSFERIARAAKLRPIRLHDLRHVTGSLLKKLGVPPRDAMVILGHSRISVTLEIYTHVDEESRWDAVDKMNWLLGGEVA
jgi:integrase